VHAADASVLEGALAAFLRDGNSDPYLDARPS
jgi:hypothetical protein